MSSATPAASASGPAAPGAEGRTIPFDYVFRFDLEGRTESDRPGKTHSKTVAVSIEGPFTAVSIGYGVVAEATAVEFGPAPTTFVLLTTTARPQLANLRFDGILEALGSALGESRRTLGGEIGPRTAVALQNGIRLHPRFAAAAMFGGGTADLDPAALGRLFQVVPLPTEDIQFLYSIRDEGSGREFQSEAILNTAGLGIANGDRPFRHFARPMRFGPRSTIRMDVTELSSFKGLLHVSLHGYKTLGRGAARGRRVR